MKRILLLSSIALSVSLLILLASDPGVPDWPMWGGTPDRNMVSPMKGNLLRRRWGLRVLRRTAQAESLVPASRSPSTKV